MSILGLSAFYHDSAAALLVGGSLAAAAEEERFRRVKHYSGFPSMAVGYCLGEAGLALEEVEHIVFYEKPLLKFDRIVETLLDGWPSTFDACMKGLPGWLSGKLDHRRLIRRELKTDKPILFSSHHLSHLACAYLTSPFDEAAILTVDGVGEWTTTALAVGRGSGIEPVSELRFPHSLGLLYATLTAYLGFKVNDDEWKVMGLAPYGKPLYLDRLRRVVEVREDGSFRLDLNYFSFHRSATAMFNRRWEELFGRPARRPEEYLDEFHADMACSGQKLVEEILVGMAVHARRVTGCQALCLGGGVALNGVANWRVFEEAGFTRMHTQPVPGDSGGALGAALLLENTVLKRPRRFHMRHACYGPSHGEGEIRKALSESLLSPVEFQDEPAFLAAVAELLAEGKVVGWYQGRMEFGPRALGARSILADPRSPGVKELINSKIKYRESFRPFAPSVLLEEASKYFDMPAGMESPFMALVPFVRPEMRGVIPGVTHVDGSARVQTLTEEANGAFYRLVREFGRRTGVPVVLNTSFNVRGEAIVDTPRQAVETFQNTGMDALAIGGMVVVK